jgi:hypothetical protein
MEWIGIVGPGGTWLSSWGGGVDEASVVAERGALMGRADHGRGGGGGAVEAVVLLGAYETQVQLEFLRGGAVVRELAAGSHCRRDM